jgi:serine phosphatase RsbU (regulator of sigma subunit)
MMELSETVLAGLGRVGIITGDPGIGKSRLVMEWKRNIRSLHQPTQIQWIESQGFAFGRELAYHLLKGLLRNTLKIPDSASLQQAGDILTAAINNLIGTDNDKLYLYLAHLLEIPLSAEQESHIHQLNALELRSQYQNALIQLYKQLAVEQPLVVILEDLHWADASSIDLLIDLLPITASSPILFCLISRPDRDSHGWRLIRAVREIIGPRFRRIDLTNLSEENSQVMVRNLIDIDEIPTIIRDVVLAKSEGNPYFIEELIRMLINEGTLIRRNDRWVISSKVDPRKIPDSLQGLLAARIDRLPPEARVTLRIASMIGRTFPESVIEHVMKTHVPGLALMEQLSILESIGMVRVAQVKPELIYQFQHILLHEAVYSSIIETDRHNLHLSVGEALENLYPDQKERLASQLAHHFLEAREDEKARHYFDLAGHVAMDAFANAESEHYFNQAIALTDDNQELAHLYADLGESLAQQAKHREAIQAWNNAINYLKSVNETNQLARIYAKSARSAWWGYDPKRSLEICLEGLKAVEGAVESPDIAYLIHETGRAYLFNDLPEKARAYSEQALEMAKRLDAYDVQAESLATIGILPTVKPKQAIAALEMAVRISESHHLFGSASRAYINLAAVIDNLGEIRLARDYRIRAIDIGNRAGGVSDEIRVNQAIANASLWLADFQDAEERINQMRQGYQKRDAYLDENTLNLLYLQGNLNRLRGDFSMAVEIFTDLIDRSRQVHDAERVLLANRALAEVTLETYLLTEDKDSRSNIDVALSLIDDAFHSKEMKTRPKDVSTCALFSDIYAVKGDFLASEEALEAANEYYRGQPVMHDRVKIVTSQSRLEAARNNTQAALDHLLESAEMLEKMEGRWWRARILLEMGNLHLKRNEPEDVDQAQSYFRDALAEFKEMNVNYYPDVIIDKLRQVRNRSRAQAIAHRKLNQELAEAGRVQHTFIPAHSPEIPGYDISGVLLPARETSGDFYDFIDLGDGKLGIAVADVGDKGAGAALYMAMSRTLIRTYAGENRLSPEEVVNQVNRRILVDTQRGIFLTLVFGILDTNENTLTYVNAGHNPPILVKPLENGYNLSSLLRTGTLVGLFQESTWEARTIELNPGETLVFYTDGITEAQDEYGEFFDSKRLAKVLGDVYSPSAETYRNAILESVQTFTGAAPRLDDITLIVITRKDDAVE